MGVSFRKAEAPAGVPLCLFCTGGKPANLQVSEKEKKKGGGGKGWAGRIDVGYKMESVNKRHF